MSYNNRTLSPGGRRIHNPGRLSDQTLSNPYYDQRHNSYASPRNSTAGVIPISTQTFINNPPPASTRPEQRYDSYSGRPRRSSLVDTSRGSTASVNTQPTRNRPTVIQQDFARPASPQKVSRDNKDYYVTPASSQEPRNSSTTHKKLYSVDDGSAKLVADVNIPVQAGGERHHKRRDSVERSGYRSTGAERDRGRRSYHANGTLNRPRDKSIDEEGAYEYTDPAAMYRDTEPRWREARPRRGSLDRGSRERPVSVLDPTFGTRAPAKEIGPPPSTRGWDKINENLGRTRSVRDEPRVAQSPTRGRTHQEAGAYGDPRDPYYVPPRTNSTDRRATIHNYDTYEYEDRREPRRPERRHSISRDGRGDRSIERRGFGIRSDQRNESQSRYGRGSDESIDHQKYRDSGYLEPPHRRETAPEYLPHDISRLEQEKRDRELAQRIQNDEQGRARERGYSADNRDYSKEPRRRDDGPAYGGDYERAPRDRDYDRDRERERERVRQMEPPSDRDRERHHYRRDTDRDREYSRKENSPRQSGEALSKGPGLAQAATGGLAGAAAAFGVSGLLNKVGDKRDKEKDRDDYQERDRVERPERNERRNGDRNPDDRDREYARDRRPGDDSRDRRPGQTASDEGQQRERNAERDRYKDNDRGLGFAFEAPEPPRSAPPSQTEWNQQYQERRPEWNAPTNNERSQDKQMQDRTQERVGQRDFDREREPENKTTEMPGTFVDPDEDYRRRVEQAQKELGRTNLDQRDSDSEADRERRRREREQRLRGREGRNGVAVASNVGVDTAGINEMPPHPALRRDFDDQSTVTAPSTVDSSLAPGLKRKPSILDQPMMTSEPVQIIDNSQSDKRENRVRIVDPPTEEEERRPRGILKKPTEKFPEDPNAVREGVAPLKDATKKGIPPGARWTKIDRRLVNPEALEAAHERFEERLDCVIVLRVLTKEEIQKLADRTREIRDTRYEEERSDRKPGRRSQRNRDRRDDEYEYSDSENEFKEKAPKMLEAPSTAGASSNADFIRENRERRHERERDAEPNYMSGGMGRRDDSQARY